MNVQELIDQLNLVEDKTLEVKILEELEDTKLLVSTGAHIELSKNMHNLVYCTETGNNVPISNYNVVVL